MSQKIDAHQHFWNPRRGDYGWLGPEQGALFRNFGPQDLRPLLDAAGIQGTVLVQAAPTVAETEYMLGIADATDFVLGVVGWFDFENPASLVDFERLARHPRLKGFRPMIQDIADPAWMLGPGLDWAFKALIAHDLAFDALVRPQHLDSLLRLLARYPDLRAVIDHGAKPHIRDGSFDAWSIAMARIAAQTGALCKLSGLVTEADHRTWNAGDLRPYVEHLLATFGPERLIFGSDWPVCTLAADYGRWVDTAQELTEGCSAGERMAIFGGNAAAFYRLAG
jgi:L-fuconolactonase